MYLNQDVLINLAPIFFAIIFTIVFSLTVFHKLKIRWPIKANCWFCNCNAYIWRYQIDWWLCPSCKQYNGFSKDGDYKYHIAEQKKVPQSVKFYASRRFNTLSESKNCLCVNCNENEELKLLELRKFEEQRSQRTEKEIQEFKKAVEKKYPLCSVCKQLVSDVLHKQLLWLAKYKMMFFKQRPIKAVIASGYKVEKIFRLLLVIIDSIIVYNSAFWPLSVVGVILQLGILFTRSTCEKQRDICLTILWIFISILSSSHEINLFKADFKKWWISLEYITNYHFITILGSIIGFMNIKTKSYKATTRNVSFKKLDACANDAEFQTSQSSLTKPLSTCSFSTVLSAENLNRSDRSESSLHFPVNVANTLINSGSLKSETPIHSAQLLKDNQSYSDQFSTLKTLRKESFLDTRKAYNTSSNERENLFFYENLQNLSALSLSQANSEKLSKASNVFETKVYSASTSVLFSKNKQANKKSILAPPKLKSVTQGSWVAGGYWQSGMEPLSLSRSSSHSSGFGSAGSNLGPSREPSVYNDFDQCSILSDATQCCSSRRYNQISFNCNCRLNSLFVRPTSPTCSHLSNLTHSQTTCNNILPFMHLQMDNPSISYQCEKSSECLINHSQQVPIYTGHTTVITSSVWLSALLCGSLIFNIIVLCIVLLH